MKVLASVKRICRNCKIIKRKGVVRVICSSDPRHKQRQANFAKRIDEWHVSQGSTSPITNIP